MLKHPELTLARVERFIRNELQPRIWASQVPMQAGVYRPSGNISPSDAPRQVYTPVQPATRGDRYGAMRGFGLPRWFPQNGAVTPYAP